MPGTVCVLGSLNVDLAVRAPRLPTLGETVLGGSFATFPGGKGANQAVAAARAGPRTGRVRMVGCTGADAHGEHLLGVLRMEGIDNSRVRTVPDAPTGVALITIDERTGENTIVVAGGANLQTTGADAVRSVSDLTADDVLLMQLETPLAGVTRAVGAARSRGATVILNAAPAPPGGLPRDLLSNLDVLIVNETESALLAGLGPAADVAALDLLHAAASLGARVTVLTAGSRGALARVDGRNIRCDAFHVDAVDTVGCGDAFCGTFAAALAAEPAASRLDVRTIAAAVLAASGAGALAATKRGAIPSLPRRAEIEALIARQPGVRSEEFA